MSYGGRFARGKTQQPRQQQSCAQLVAPKERHANERGSYHNDAGTLTPLYFVHTHPPIHTHPLTDVGDDRDVVGRGRGGPVLRGSPAGREELSEALQAQVSLEFYHIILEFFVKYNKYDTDTSRALLPLYSDAVWDAFDLKITAGVENRVRI